MKRFVLVLLGILALAVAAGPVAAACQKTGIQTDTSNSVDTVFFYDRGRRFDAASLRIWLDASASSNATIRRGVRISADSIYFFESAQTMRPGGRFEGNEDGVYCFEFTKGSSDKLLWSASNCAQPSLLDESSAILTEIRDGTAPEWVTLVNGMTIPAAKHMTFPMPLASMGDFKQASFQISCTTWPDTLWYQIVATNTAMDSLTVFNWGTTEAPNFCRYIVRADIFGASSAVTTKCEYLDNAFTEKWSPTGLAFTPVVTAGGQNVGSRYIGIRVGADVDSPIVGLRVVLELK